MDQFIHEVASKISKHKIIPFIGAGCSAPMLNIDWDCIVANMKSELYSKFEGHLEIAQDFVDKRGKESFCEYLSKYFIKEYDIVFVVMAIDKLRSWGDIITNEYREFITQRVDYSMDFNELSDTEQTYVKEQLDYAWKG